MNRTFFLVFLLILLSLLSCCKSPIGPDGYKDPRQLSWTFDTIAYPGSMQTNMQKLWASSATNIYVVGHNDQPGPGTMFTLKNGHWTTTKFHAVEGGPVNGPVTVHSITGLDKNDVWAVGEHIFDNPNPPPNFLDSSLIIHFDGTNWREYRIEGGRVLLSLWAGSSDNVWTCGNQGSLFHYTGIVWERDSVPLIPPPANWDYYLWDITGNRNGDVYILGYIRNDSDGTMTYYLFHKKDTSQWNIIDSMSINKLVIDDHFGVYSLWTSPSGKMYSSDGNVFRFNGSGWDKIYSGVDALLGLFGNIDDNIFAVGDFGNVLHFDGTSWATITQLKYQNISWTSGWTDGKEVFICGITLNGYPMTTIIAHGR